MRYHGFLRYTYSHFFSLECPITCVGFEPQQSETAFLRQRLLEEQADARRAHQARLEAEARCHAAERERDVYRLLANRWQTRLQDLLRRQGGDAAAVAAAAGEDDDAVVRNVSMEAALDAILQDRHVSRAIVLSAVLPRRLHHHDDEEEEEEDADDVEEETNEMEEDEEMQAEVAMLGSHDEDVDDVSQGMETSSRRSNRAYSVTMEDASVDDSEMAASPSNAKAIASRQQARTVSICSDDL